MVNKSCGFETDFRRVDSIALLSTLYFTAHKMHKSGAGVSAIEHRRLNIESIADCLAPARTSLRLPAAPDAGRRSERILFVRHSTRDKTM